MKIVKVSPLLQDKTRLGKPKFWMIMSLEEDGKFYLKTEYWQNHQDGSEGVHQTSEPIEVEGKNIGKSNETSAEEQSYLMMNSFVLRQKDRGYYEDGENIENRLLLPMLAKKVVLEKARFPAYAQPKFNGVRALSDGQIFWSRKAKLYPEECISHLQFSEILEKSGMLVLLDGELMIPHTSASFQKSISAIKKFDPTTSPSIQYYVYDCIIMTEMEATYSRRFEVLNFIIDMIKKEKPEIKIEAVRTDFVNNLQEILSFHDEITSKGYEGTMIRYPSGIYQPGDRSSELLKLKDMQDAEFTIVGFKEGKGKDKGTAIFECKVESGLTFNVRPEGVLAERQKYLKDAPTLIGKQLTVRFQEFSDDGIPIFPVGVSVRDYE